MAATKNICILGSTGSIGRSSLDVIANFPGTFRPLCLTAHSNTELLLEQIQRFRPHAVAVLDEQCAARLKQSVNGSTKVYAGAEGLNELVRREDVDIVINSLVGFAGLRPTVEALRLGKTVALANKETLVVAGEIITRLARAHNARIIPIDSEHSAILQCLAGEDPASIARLILTASGGPFLHLPKSEFSKVTVEAALKHPNWKMGNKITIDSATMMNKGLEIIEAHWLFGLPASKIEVLIHPQSIIHSMVEFIDGSVKAQLGIPDMKIPIQYALTYPDRAASVYRRIDFADLKTMTFLEPDREKFDCLNLAYEALAQGGTAPVVLNAANEVAVELFLGNAITFERIPQIIRTSMKQIPLRPVADIDDIIAADRLARETARRVAADPA
jgi:1-deoxy-D-xylulose-5-phosphate reductoisomerase